MGLRATTSSRKPENQTQGDHSEHDAETTAIIATIATAAVFSSRVRPQSVEVRSPGPFTIIAVIAAVGLALVFGQVRLGLASGSGETTRRVAAVPLNSATARAPVLSCSTNTAQRDELL